MNDEQIKEFHDVCRRIVRGLDSPEWGLMSFIMIMDRNMIHLKDLLDLYFKNKADGLPGKSFGQEKPI